VRRKLSHKFLFPLRLVVAVVDSLAKAATLVTPADLPVDTCRDPSDIPVLGTAIAGDAEFLVSWTMIPRPARYGTWTSSDRRILGTE